MRIAFTIILNGLNHLKHNNYYEFLVKNFDYWVVVEGASQNNGSTKWCKSMPDKWHKNGKSIDGTVDFMIDLKNKYSNIIFVESNGMWNSKDDMVNKAIEEIKKITNKCFLWQVDIDEQWTLEQIIKSEKELINNDAKSARFYVNHFVGENLITDGDYGGGPDFIRLWDWKGESFILHEPPILSGNGKNIIINEKINHYSYYFEEDVKFKDEWYTNHDGVYDGWKKLKTETIFPQIITYLFPKFVGKNSKIIKL